jgi:hypothetical protein
MKGDSIYALKLRYVIIGLQTPEELCAESVPDFLISHKVVVLPLGANHAY